jgi:hypothetical protein
MTNLDPNLVKVYEALEEFTKSGALDKLNSAPPPTAGTNDNAGPRLMSKMDQIELRQRLVRKSVPELMAIFNDQAARSDQGVPFGSWLANSGNPLAISQTMQRQTPDAQLLTKAVDSAGASALIRQDLEPVLYALFVKQFPEWDRIQKKPANGLLHAWNKITSYGDAQFMPELGTVTDDNNTYVRASTNVAVLARRVGVSLKSQFAVQQGGAGYDLEQQELTGGLRAIAHKLQKTIFQGNAAVSGGTASDENGAYDANGFTGLRQLLASRAYDIDISSTTITSQDGITEGIGDAVVSIVNNGGQPSVVLIRADEQNAWTKQQLPIVRIMDKVEFVPGLRVPAVATPAGDLPLVAIPGDSIGHYTNSANSKDSADIYVVDESTLALPYLGSDGIVTLDIPIGVGGQLVHYFILYCMFGLELATDLFSAKARAQLAA